jgi:hypothetical protein
MQGCGWEDLVRRAVRGGGATTCNVTRSRDNAECGLDRPHCISEPLNHRARAHETRRVVRLEQTATIHPIETMTIGMPGSSPPAGRALFARSPNILRCATSADDERFLRLGPYDPETDAVEGLETQTMPKHGTSERRKVMRDNAAKKAKMYAPATLRAHKAAQEAVYFTEVACSSESGEEVPAPQATVGSRGA